MTRIEHTTYAESVSCTPIFEYGECNGPMLNGITYMVRPSMHPGNRSPIARSASAGLIQLPSWPLAEPLGTFTASRRSAVHMNVRLSTRATSLGQLRAKKLRAEHKKKQKTTTFIA